MAYMSKDLRIVIGVLKADVKEYISELDLSIFQKKLLIKCYKNQSIPSWKRCFKIMSKTALSKPHTGFSLIFFLNGCFGTSLSFLCVCTLHTLDRTWR